MPFVFNSITTNPNKSVSFTFEQPVVNYVVGYAYSSFTYGSKDHHVQKYALKLTTNQPSSTQLIVNVTGVLQDSSGNTIDNGSSTVTVCVIAWVGTNPGTIALTSATGINNDSSSGPIPLPSSNLSTLQSILSGFDLAYDKDHHVLYETSGVGTQQSGSTGYITGKVAMGDSSGNVDSTASVSGGLIAVAGGTDSGASFTVVPSKQTTGSFKVSFGQTLSNAIVFVVDSYAAYSADHHVKTVGAGSSGWSVSGNTVTLNNASAFISDGSGNHQDNDKSSVTLLVVGLHA